MFDVRATNSSIGRGALEENDIIRGILLISSGCGTIPCINSQNHVGIGIYITANNVGRKLCKVTTK